MRAASSDSRSQSAKNSLISSFKNEQIIYKEKECKFGYLYEINSILGEGGFGYVVAGYFRKTKEPCAIKVDFKM